MKKVILIVFAVFIYSISFCQQKVSIDSVSKFIGDTITVCSKVYGVKVLENETFVNLGARYPESPLALVIFTKDISNFNGTIESLYADKSICVTGVIELYKDKPEMIISSPTQLVIQ
ncbi:MAG: hypothetical protein ACTHK0_02180 [Ginsengibacter sp.]